VKLFTQEGGYVLDHGTVSFDRYQYNSMWFYRTGGLVISIFKATPNPVDYMNSDEDFPNGQSSPSDPN